MAQRCPAVATMASRRIGRSGRRRARRAFVDGYRDDRYAHRAQPVQARARQIAGAAEEEYRSRLARIGRREHRGSDRLQTCGCIEGDRGIGSGEEQRAHGGDQRWVAAQIEAERFARVGVDRSYVYAFADETEEIGRSGCHAALESRGGLARA